MTCPIQPSLNRLSREIEDTDALDNFIDDVLGDNEMMLDLSTQVCEDADVIPDVADALLAFHVERDVDKRSQIAHDLIHRLSRLLQGKVEDEANYLFTIKGNHEHH